MTYNQNNNLSTRSAFVAIVGRPNVGKSSLLNALVGEKIAITSSKPQTTRTRITGVLTQDDTQYIFIDTPGLHRPKTKLSEHMVKAVTDSVAEVDIALMVTEPSGPIGPDELSLMESFRARNMHAILLINKVDLLQEKASLIKRIDEFSQLHHFDEIIPISVSEKDGLDLVLQNVRKYAKPSPFFYPDDMLTDQPERVIAAEIIREKLLNSLKEEVPHGIAVAIESMKEREGRPLVDVEAVIYCERKSHKGIVIGKNGAMLKKIASEARAEIQSFLDVKVNLQCWVKVREDWRNKENLIKTLGLS